ncbi:DUF2207 domain-containing protein [Candidatus Avelusimicrobium luingense]|uniref:DUF2207 domain-containing protein n=1 Tax=Candidatus Avelusimicrobium luingense TaxID=3416211 RepID=UPI003D0A2E02
MKKIYSLLLVAFLLPTLGIISNAQTYDTSANDPEKIYLFDSDITVHTDGSITVVETITLNVKHQNINRGIYRDIPFSLKESIEPLSLTFDGVSHPFFIEFKGKIQRINFGDDNYIPWGKHTYTFTYKFTGAIDFYQNHDELYWNVTGSDWAFSIDKARVHVTFPEQVQIQKDGISLYTGYKGSKANYTEEVGKLTYETTRPLSPHEGMTIAIPFYKGVIQKPSSFQSLRLFFAPASILALLLLVGLFIYFISTWIMVGIDPSYLLVPQYEPPQNISPAFMHYLCTQELDTTAIACMLLDLAMKGYIEIKENKSFFAMDKATIILKNRDTLDLPEEEAGLITLLFPHGTDTFSLGPYTAQRWKPFHKGIEKLFRQNAKEYIISHSSYIKKAVIGMVILGLVPPLCLGKIGFPLIFINLHFAVFFTLTSIIHSRIGLKVILGLAITAFYSAFWIPMSLQAGPAALICSLSYVLGMWGLSFYVTLIRNVTERGKELFAHIYGFKKYMKTAEINRVYASDPTKAEQIFCAFLPFAFAFGLENKWMKKFEGVLSKAIIDKCTSAAGGMRFISSGGLSKSVSSGGGGGGSHGGGHAGGGHGGGGGGGR